MNTRFRDALHFASSPTEPLFSVVVCTHNRARLLDICLRTLGRQSLPTSAYEVIVVDNNSTDTTRAVAETHRAGNANFVYVFESKQGLSHARNTGYRAARGQYIAYVDDESRIPADWLTKADTIVNRPKITHGPPVCFGGPYKPWYEGAKPAWFKDIYASGPAVRFTPHILQKDEFLSGGNFFVRRETLIALGGFDPHYGMTGNRLGFGEESELQLRIRNHYPQAQILFSPDLNLYHLARPEKTSLWKTALRRFHGGRVSQALFLLTDSDRNVGTTRRDRLQLLFAAWAEAHLRLAACGFGLTLGVALRNRDQYPYVQNYLYERVLGHIRAIGKQTQIMESVLRGRPQTAPNNKPQ